MINLRFIIRLRPKRQLVRSVYIKRGVVELLTSRILMYIRERSLDKGVTFMEYLFIIIRIRTARLSIIRIQYN